MKWGDKMDIIISANEKILSLTQNKSMNLSESMNEEEYRHWIENIAKVGMDDEAKIQEISV